MKYRPVRMSFLGVFFSMVVWSCVPVWASAISPSPTPSWPLPPKIKTLLKPQVYDRAVKNREVMTHAVLDDYIPDPHSSVVPYAAPTNSGPVSALPSASPKPSPSPLVSVGAPPAVNKKIELKKYTYYSAMLVHATPNRTRQVLTHYGLYSKLVPYVQKSDYDVQTHNLEIVGGVLGWTLHSLVHFEERSDSWIHFEVVQGHFQGMNGDIYFESYGDSNTLVYLGGSQVLSQWPPQFILENGEEIVFGFTSNRMRSYIESPEPGQGNGSSENPGDKGKKNDAVPQPRSRL